MNEGQSPAYDEVRLEVPRLLADAVCNFIIDNICSGLVLEEEEDSATTGIRFYVSGELDKHRRSLGRYLAQLANESMPTPPVITSRIVRDVEWEKQYRATIKPIRVTDDIVIRPPWDCGAPEAVHDIIIEPKMAFGTGRHETTRSCLQAIRREFHDGRRFLDIGCGSGILSILADRMGASYIKAVDNDMAAVENCRENFALNKVTTPHDILLGSIEQCRDDKPYCLVCANIIKETILELLGRLCELTDTGGTLVLSGLLDRDETEVSKRLIDADLPHFGLLRDDEWLTYAVSKD